MKNKLLIFIFLYFLNYSAICQDGVRFNKEEISYVKLMNLIAKEKASDPYVATEVIKKLGYEFEGVNNGIELYNKTVYEGIWSKLAIYEKGSISEGDTVNVMVVLIITNNPEIILSLKNEMLGTDNTADYIITDNQGHPISDLLEKGEYARVFHYAEENLAFTLVREETVHVTYGTFYAYR